MEGIEHWKDFQKYSLLQAVLLHIGVNPARTNAFSEASCRIDPEIRLMFIPARNKFIQAIEESRLRAQVVRGPAPGNRIDMEKTFILLENIQTWLHFAKIPSEFFGESGEPDYLNPKHKRYAPKLAAVVNAWLEIEGDPELERLSAKQVLTKWLRGNARKFELADKAGNPKETSIDECARVGNWERKGGRRKKRV